MPAEGSFMGGELQRLRRHLIDGVGYSFFEYNNGDRIEALSPGGDGYSNLFHRGACIVAYSNQTGEWRCFIPGSTLINYARATEIKVALENVLGVALFLHPSGEMGVMLPNRQGSYTLPVGMWIKLLPRNCDNDFRAFEVATGMRSSLLPDVLMDGLGMPRAERLFCNWSTNSSVNPPRASLSPILNSSTSMIVQNDLCAICASYNCIRYECSCCKKTTRTCKSAFPNYANSENSRVLCSNCSPLCIFCKQRILKGKACRTCSKYLIPEAIDKAEMRDYSWKPLIWPLIKLRDDSESERLFGLEIEMERKGAMIKEDTIRNCYMVAKHVLGESFIIKRDGSLVNGIELVLAPHSLGALKERVPALLHQFRELGFFGHIGHRCGLHVHTQNVEPRLSLSIKNFIAQNRLFFTAFSRRKETELARYAVMPAPRKVSYVSSSKYYAVNDGGGLGTIEFRLFRGTTSGRTILASVECVKSLIEYARENPQRSFFESSDPTEELRAYLSFANDKGYVNFAHQALRAVTHLKSLKQISEKKRKEPRASPPQEPQMVTSTIAERRRLNEGINNTRWANGAPALSERSIHDALTAQESQAERANASALMPRFVGLNEFLGNSPSGDDELPPF